MSNGVLQFTLGLTAGGFIGAIGQANHALTGFIGGMFSLGAVAHGVMEQIEKGAALEHLHKRSGENVEDLFNLEKGFKAAGLSAEDVGPTLFYMQKALGGVNEMGEKTSDIFKRMGLDVGALKSTGGAEALQQILDSMGSLNQSELVKASSSIFGRMQAGNMVQLARSSHEFAAGMASASEQAKLFQRNAAMFEHLELTLGKVQMKSKALFIGIAEGAAPAISNILDQLNKINLTGVGVQIGHFLTALTQAFSEGTLSQLIGESVRTGFEIGIASLPALFEKLGAMILNIFKTPLDYIQAFYTYMVQEYVEFFAHLFSKPGNVGDIPADSFEKILADQKASGPKFFTEGLGLDDMNADADKRWQEAREKIKKISEPLMSLIDGLVSRAPKPGQSEKLRGVGTGSIYADDDKKIKATDLEKMGFVFGGGRSSTDHAQRTAENTARTADHLKTANVTLKQIAVAIATGHNFANI